MSMCDFISVHGDKKLFYILAMSDSNITPNMLSHLNFLSYATMSCADVKNIFVSISAFIKKTEPIHYLQKNRDDMSHGISSYLCNGYRDLDRHNTSVLLNIIY